MKRLVVIVGPTASGKTEMAIRLAQALNTEIVSCDSRQFYSELNIGVARPSPDELAAATHHFIACRSVTNPLNAFQYADEAMALLDKLFLKHDVVIAVGGSGLYVDALCKGINILPDPSPQLREELSQRAASGGLPSMLEELQRLDPEYYAIVDRKNPIRVQRALETILTSGKSYSELISKELSQRPFKVVKIGIQCEREELRDRIDRRVDIMVQQGLVDEAASLLPFRDLNTLNTVGYKELFQHFDGTIGLQKAIVDIKNHTWQYAKKQMTWLKRYDDVHWIERKKNVEQMQVLGLI